MHNYDHGWLTALVFFIALYVNVMKTEVATDF